MILASGPPSLTAIERTVSLLVAGTDNGGVARRLHRWPDTPAPRFRQVFAELGVPNRVAFGAVAHHSIE